jgi:DNA-binding response OmpR family regulator
MEPIDLLLIDDDVELCASLSRLLAMDGFAVSAVHDADAGIREAASGRYQLVILDVMLPGGDGRKVLKRIRRTSAVPVVMLTARGDETERIAGLDAGADDYLPKPFHPRELVARIRAVLRRNIPAPLPDVFSIGDLRLDRKTRIVLREEKSVELTAAEFDILLLLARSAGKVVSREEIAEEALGRPIGMLDRSIDNHINNLRKKLGTHAGGVERIRNIRGTGYLYADPGAALVQK